MANFPKPIALLIFDYVEPWRLREWIPEGKITRPGLWANPRAIDMCKRLRLEISWNMLSRNPHPQALHILGMNPEKICAREFACNPAVKKKHFHNRPGLWTTYVELSNDMNTCDIRANPAMGKYLHLEKWVGSGNLILANPDEDVVAFGLQNDWYDRLDLDKRIVCRNPNPRVIDIVYGNPIAMPQVRSSDRPCIYGNPIDQVRSSDRTCILSHIARNPDPRVLALIESQVLINPSCIDMLIDVLAENPGIFELDERILKILSSWPVARKTPVIKVRS
jgi:hypothetical protein